MKQVTFFLVLFMLSFNIQAQVANGGFENWETIEAYEQPIGFATGNRSVHALNISGQVASIPYVVTKVDGSNGGHAVRLETADQGIASTSGTVGTDDIFLSGFETLPYTGTPSQIMVSIRHSIVDQDSADFLFVFMKSGSEINRVNFKAGGEAMNFTTKTVDVPAFTEAPDAIGIRIRNSDRINLNSWLELDLIEFGGTTEQLENNSFDNWAFVTYEEPIDWGSSNFATQPLIEQSGVSQSSDAFSGSSAMQIVALPKSDLIRASTNPNFTPIGYNTDVTTVIEDPSSGSPVGSNNNAVFQYKYSGATDEVALIAYSFLNDVGVSFGSDTLILDQVAEWTMAEIPFIDVNNATQIVMAFAPGYFDDKSYNEDGGSILLIDDVELNIVTSTRDLGQLENFNAYYNYDAGQVTVRFQEAVEEGQVTLYQANGKKILDEKFKNQSEVNYPIFNLPTGIYIVDIITIDKRASVRLYID